MTSSSWIFGGNLTRNAFLRNSKYTKPYAFLYKVRPRTSMIYLCGATGARRFRVCGRIIVGSVPYWNGVLIVFRVYAVGRIPLWFVTIGSFPQCKWDRKWCWWISCRWNFIYNYIVPAILNGIASGTGGGVTDGVLKEVSYEIRFWEIADIRKPMFFYIKSVPKPRWFTSAVRRVRNGFVCGWIMFRLCSDYGRIMIGSVPHCKWGFTCVLCMCG